MNKNKLLKWAFNTGKAAGAVCLILIPVISYLLFEYVTGNLMEITSRYMILLNICWIAVLYLAAFALTGNTRIAIPAVSLIFFLLSLAETFVVSFRGRPVMFWDILALQTAMSVSGNYNFSLTAEMRNAFLLLLLVNTLIFLFPVKIRKIKFRLALTGSAFSLIAGFGIWFYSSFIPSRQLGINMWEVNQTYQEYGYVLATAISFQYSVKKPPAGYSTMAVNSIYNDISEDRYPPFVSAGDSDLESNSPVPVNIICIMNESLSELRTGGDFETNTEYFPFLYSLKENTVSGSLCVPVFGSSTSNSEYEFLTGNSIALLPANCIAYQFCVKPNADSLARILGLQGYHTVAMHPCPGSNWNRIETYHNMGFDEFLDIDAYKDSGELRNYVSDQADYEKLIEMVEQKKNPDDKLFLFNVTMQNHGGYEDSFDNFIQDIWLTGDLEGKYPKTDQYLSLIKKSDEALEYLISYFKKSEQPTMIVLFRDHQPAVEDEFFDEIAGIPSNLVPDPEHLMWYETPFFIWTNYPSESEEKGEMGAVYLASEILERAGLSLSPFNRFLLKMEEELPIVHPLGCFDRDGNYYSWIDLERSDNPYYELVRDYQYLVCNQVFDPKKNTSLFLPED